MSCVIRSLVLLLLWGLCASPYTLKKHVCIFSTLHILVFSLIWVPSFSNKLHMLTLFMYWAWSQPLSNCCPLRPVTTSPVSSSSLQGSFVPSSLQIRLENMDYVHQCPVLVKCLMYYPWAYSLLWHFIPFLASPFSLFFKCSFSISIKAISHFCW